MSKPYDPTSTLHLIGSTWEELQPEWDYDTGMVPVLAAGNRGGDGYTYWMFAGGVWPDVAIAKGMPLTAVDEHLEPCDVSECHAVLMGA